MGQQEDYLEKGKDLLKQGKYDEALKYFDSALELDPQDYSTWMGRGDVLEKLQRYEEALKSYDKAIALNPEEDFAWYLRGNVLGKLQRYAEALESYDKAIEAASDKALPFFAKGQLQVAQKQLIEALVSFQESLRLSEAKKDTDWIRLTEFWIQDVEKRIEEQKAKKEPPVEVQIIRTIRENLQRTPDENPLKRIRDREKSYQEYFMRPRTIKSNSNWIAVLRRWNSFTPKIPNREAGKKGVVTS